LTSAGSCTVHLLNIRSPAVPFQTNCLTEVFFDDAIAQAAELDAFLAREGRPVGPLHGLPISLKDNFKIKGLDATVGFVAWCNEPMEEDSVMTTLLRQAGAVLYCKTNVPTAMVSGPAGVSPLDHKS
jgi:amidase